MVDTTQVVAIETGYWWCLMTGNPWFLSFLADFGEPRRNCLWASAAFASGLLSRVVLFGK